MSGTELSAFPYRVGPYRPNYVASPTAMQTWLAEHLPTSRRITIDGVSAFLCRDTAHQSTLFVNEDDTLLYVMELHKLRVSLTHKLPAVLTRRSNYQGSVWRDKRLQRLHDTFSSAVFTKLLVSDSRNVVSDSQQSPDGESFWYRRCLFALRAGFHVYGLDCESDGTTLVIDRATRLLDLQLFDTFYTEGPDFTGYYRRLAIAKPTT